MHNSYVDFLSDKMEERLIIDASMDAAVIKPKPAFAPTVQRKVLIDMNRLGEDQLNGLYQYSEYLGQSIARLPQDQFEWNFFMPRRRFGIFGNSVSYVPQHRYNKYFMSGTSQFDIWHITNQISWYHPFNTKSRVVFTIHDLNFLLDEKHKQRRNDRLLKLVQERIYRSHHLTAISNFAKTQLQEHTDTNGLPITVIHNGCTVNNFPLFNSPRYRPAKPFIFSIGTFEPRKNFHVLPALLKNNDYELIISGPTNGRYLQEIIASAKKHQVLNRVKITGGISEEEKYWYHKNCLAFCFPSVAEGFGLPVIESMHFGKPVFLSTSTCLPEIGGEYAYYFHDFDPVHMSQVFEEGLNHYYHHLPSAAIIKYASQFNWDTAAAKYSEVYNQVLMQA